MEIISVMYVILFYFQVCSSAYWKNVNRYLTNISLLNNFYFYIHFHVLRSGLLQTVSNWTDDKIIIFYFSIQIITSLIQIIVNSFNKQVLHQFSLRCCLKLCFIMVGLTYVFIVFSRVTFHNRVHFVNKFYHRYKINPIKL